jgi:hypothetical protein
LGLVHEKPITLFNESAGVGVTVVFEGVSVTAVPSSYWGNASIFLQPLTTNSAAVIKENMASNFFI